MTTMNATTLINLTRAMNEAETEIATTCDADLSAFLENFEGEDFDAEMTPAQLRARALEVFADGLLNGAVTRAMIPGFFDGEEV